jgi:3-(3-hydroxy-phenyl)propionate hydroxylase
MSEWGAPDQFEIRRSAVYRFFARVAAEWRQGRVLLAGDAAHQTPPFIGQGMCQGIRDAGNLRWKLKAVLRDGLDDALLDTYQAERKPHVITTTSRTKALGLEICMLDRAKAAERDRLLEAELDEGGKPTSRQSLIPGLEAGVLDLDGEGKPRGPAGTLFPQPKVRTADGGTALLDDIVAPGFLVVFGPKADGIGLDGKRTAAIKALGGEVVTVRQEGAQGAKTANVRVIEELDGLLSGYFDEMGAVAFIVRPDHYIFAMAKAAAELNGQLDDLANLLGMRGSQLTSAAQ